VSFQITLAARLHLSIQMGTAWPEVAAGFIICPTLPRDSMMASRRSCRKDPAGEVISEPEFDIKNYHVLALHHHAVRPSLDAGLEEQSLRARRRTQL